MFGSCRYARPDAVTDDPHFDADALDAYAQRMARLPDERWPDALVLLGDQVYADETSERTRRASASGATSRSRRTSRCADFEEYTWLYAESLDATPTCAGCCPPCRRSMIFDDHDVRDDWNTSALWREEMQQTSWWQERIVGGLSSYWVYQHLGNLSPQTWPRPELYQQVRGSQDRLEPLLREFAAAADAEADGHKGAQWSYRRDLGGVRLLVIDSRCGRILDAGNRSMVSDAEFRWIEGAVEGDYDHLLVGTSLPWLLPRALHDIESWDERLAAGSRGPGWPGWPRSSGGPPTSSTGPRSASPSTGSQTSSPVSAAASTPARTVGRPRRSACSPATSTTPTRAGRTTTPVRALEGLPADLLAGAQLRARRDEGGVPGVLDPRRREDHPVPAQPGGARTRPPPELDPPGRAVLRRRAGHPDPGRPARRPAIEQAASRGGSTTAATPTRWT